MAVKKQAKPKPKQLGKPTPIPRGKQILSPAAAGELRNMLQGVFDDGGTASGAAIPGYDMAGKTGTANVVVHGQYSSSEYIESFIGFVPTYHPRLLVAVMVDEPQGDIYGGEVAAPAWKEITSFALNYLRIPPG